MVKKRSIPPRKAPATKRVRKDSYPCPVAKQFGCNEFFTTSGHAVRHARKHTGKKDAICPECGQAFSRKDNMEQHRRTHQDNSGIRAAEHGWFGVQVPQPATEHGMFGVLVSQTMCHQQQVEIFDAELDDQEEDEQSTLDQDQDAEDDDHGEEVSSDPLYAQDAEDDDHEEDQQIHRNQIGDEPLPAYVPSAHPCLSASTPVAERSSSFVSRAEFDMLLRRVHDLEAAAKKPATENKSTDWRVQCTHANHVLAALKADRANMEARWKWRDHGSPVPTAESCLPPHVLGGGNTTRRHTINGTCKICQERFSCCLSWQRQLALLNTPDDELWKLVENDSDGKKTYDASHLCRLTGSVQCLNHKHVILETAHYNRVVRKNHQNNGYCDCHHKGFPKCIGPGQKYVKDIPAAAGLYVQAVDERNPLTNKRARSKGVRPPIDDLSKLDPSMLVPYRGTKCDYCARTDRICDNKKPKCSVCTQRGADAKCNYTGLQLKTKHETRTKKAARKRDQNLNANAESDVNDSS